MLLLYFFQGLPTEVPGSISALLWALILAALSAIVYLYKKREDDRSKYEILLREMLTVTQTVTATMDNLKDVLEHLEEKLGSYEEEKVLRAIGQLRDEWKSQDKPK